MNELTCVLNGIKYLQFQVPLYSSIRDEIMQNIKACEGITQGVNSVVGGGLLSSGTMIINVLIPEHNVLKFNDLK